jgi:hypothetical protein
MATQLQIFNGALLLMDVGPISQSELTNGTVERARILNAAWTGAINRCLEQGLWKFAMRTSMIDSSPSLSPDFGHRYVFEHPDDYIRTNQVCSDEWFRNPLREADYTDEAGNWFASIDPIYVQYVSNDSSYGADISRWPASFQGYVEAYLAWKSAGALKGDRARAAEDMAKALKTAKSKDAMNGPPRTMPMGGWNAARMAGTTRRDGGSRSEF